MVYFLLETVHSTKVLVLRFSIFLYFLLLKTNTLPVGISDNIGPSLDSSFPKIPRTLTNSGSLVEDAAGLIMCFFNTRSISVGKTSSISKGSINLLKVVFHSMPCGAGFFLNNFRVGYCLLFCSSLHC